MLSLASDAVEELSKEKPSGEMVEYKTKDFLKTLEVWTLEVWTLGTHPLKNLEWERKFHGQTPLPTHLFPSRSWLT